MLWTSAFLAPKDRNVIHEFEVKKNAPFLPGQSGSVFLAPNKPD